LLVTLLLAATLAFQDPAPAPASLPSTPAEWTASGNAKLDAGDPDGALQDYLKAIGLDQKHAPAWNARAIALQRKGDLGGAVQDFTRALELDPSDVYYRNRASARRQQSDLRGAITDLSRAIELNPKYADAYVARASARFAADDLNGSLGDFSKALELDPRNPEVYRGMAYAKKDEGDYDGALSDIGRALALAPESAPLLASSGLIRSYKGDTPGALKDYTRAIELAPAEMSHYYFRGCVYQDGQKWPEAQADFRKAAELSSPQWEFPRLRLWLVRARLGEREAATQDLRAWLLLRKGPPGDAAARVAAYLTGTLAEKDFLKAADAEIGAAARGRRCQAYYFAGEKRLLDGERALAKDLLKRALGTEAQNWRDYGSAAAELRFMEE